MCSSCETYAEPRGFSTPEDYVLFVRQLSAETSCGKMVLIYGNCALQELWDAPPWPAGDGLVHWLQCTRCHQFFWLYANVWNGRNGWEPRSAQEWEAQKNHYIKQR